MTPLQLHVDVCPDCNTPAHGHSMDPPPIPPPECRHERERFVPVRFVEVTDDEETVERMAEAAWEATVSGHEGYEGVPVRHQCRWGALSPATRQQQIERMRAALAAQADDGGEDAA